jgi:hypothetical protein
MVAERLSIERAVNRRFCERVGIYSGHWLLCDSFRSSAWLGALLLFGVCASAHGAFFSGRDLQVPLREIRAGQPLTLGQMQALGYVQGVYDANAGLLFCSREDVDAGQVVKAVNAYLLNHPGLLEQPASVGLTAAMIDQWPCRRRG